MIYRSCLYLSLYRLLINNSSFRFSSHRHSYIISLPLDLFVPSSLIHVHRCIGSRNATRQTIPTQEKLTSVSVYDCRDGVLSTQFPRRPPPHSHMYTGVSVLGTRQTLSTSPKLTSLSMYDRRNGTTQCM
jgi:hypothetical protein